ncbi:MAG TPA: hypothetical protein VEZ48_12595 [Sphingomonadaceae bacterium]|nr:hypothetical protein [Sphingomonadaceae bacterium]
MAVAVSPLVLQAAPASIDNRIVEIQLRHRLQAEPNDPVAIARLAQHYAATDRPAKARRLYTAMMAMDDVELERANGAPMSSRLLAKSALAKIDPPVVRLGSR